MITKIETFNRTQLKKDLPDIRPGDTIRVHQKIPARIATQGVAGGKEKDKERIQVFEGIVIARKHGKGVSATITVRKVIAGIGVEKIFPIHSPAIEKIEVLKKGKVKRAKLYYLRTAKGKKARLKRKEFAEVIAEEEPESIGKKPVEAKEAKKEETKEETKKESK